MKKLITTLLAFTLLSGCTPTVTDELSEDQLASCIEEQSDFDPETEDFIRGTINVSFAESDTEEDISNTLADHGLSISEGPYFAEGNDTTVSVNVTANSEIEWVCRLLQDDNIESANKILFNS